MIDAKSYLKTITRHRQEAEEYIQQFEVKKLALEAVQERGWNYEGIDIDDTFRKKLDNTPNIPDRSYRNQRDQYMADSIHEACLRYNSGLVVSIGAAHIEVEWILTEKLGYTNIVSSYIINHSPAMAEEGNLILRHMKKRPGTIWLSICTYYQLLGLSRRS